MNFNITFFIQAFHFFIAYIILTRILLKPAVSLFAQEKKHQDRLMQEIAHERMRLTDAQEDKHKRWLYCQRSFKEHAPTLDVSTSTTEYKAIEKPDIDAKELHHISKKASAVLKDKILKQQTT
jgi:hypothetical protein